MNRKEYNSDTRYAKVLEQMDLLGIMDVTTTRQNKNGTIVWKLPIKNKWKHGKLIEVASFKTGYVRNQNSGYSNYQLNKRCENKPEYFKDYEWNDDYTKQKFTGKYRMFQTRGCVLIPIEIDRLEYLISYCLKNYYIKRANEIADGKFVPEWYHNDRLDQAKCDTEAESLNDLKSEIRDLETKYQASQADLDEAEQGHVDYQIKLEEKLFDLQNKLATIKRIADI